MLEVVSGPSLGLRYSTQSTNKSGLPLTLGRTPPNALLLKDSEVSGKHAMINWNSNVIFLKLCYSMLHIQCTVLVKHLIFDAINVQKLKWELVDMGSLNGTLLNSQVISHANSGSRHWGDPNELASGDTITLGSSSKIVVSTCLQLLLVFVMQEKYYRNNLHYYWLIAQRVKFFSQLGCVKHQSLSFRMPSG